MPGIIIQLVNFPNIYNIWNTELLGIYIEEEQQEEAQNKEKRRRRRRRRDDFFFLL
jgi:hypothetical protein